MKKRNQFFFLLHEHITKDLAIPGLVIMPHVMVNIRSPTSPRFSWVLHFISHEYPSFLKISFENKLDSINTQGCFSFGGLKQLPKLPSGLASPECLFSVFVYHFHVLGIQQKVGPECVFFFSVFIHHFHVLSIQQKARHWFVSTME
jgi:hypothetical protein